MSRWNLSWLVGITAVSLVGLAMRVGLGSGPLQSAPPRASELQAKHENLKLLVDVLEEVQQKYAKELDRGKMRDLVENMITGGLERLDPHSSFINPDEYKQFQRQSRGKFGGIGIRIGVDRAGQLFVESPMVGTPAYEAGIMAGDVIAKIDGKTAENMTLKKAVEMIQGEPGQKILLTVYHEGSKKPVDIPIVRAEIRVDSVLGDKRMTEDVKKWDFVIDKLHKIAYVRITAFTETTVEELTRVVEQLQKEGARGLVIDLRNNPGGLLRAAVEVSSLFLPDGKRVVSTKGRNHKEEIYDVRHDRNGPPPQVSYPIAILLNRYSASASEIVAAALQDHLRAVIIGERSYGKGSVQNIIPMEGGTSALKLTTASYWRPSGKNIHRFPDAKEEEEWGVRPNKGYEVKLADEERVHWFRWRQRRDVVRRPGEPAPKAKEGEKAVPADFKDRVLEKALEYVREEQKKAANPAAAPDNRGAEARPMPMPEQPAASGRAAVEPRSRPDIIDRNDR